MFAFHVRRFVLDTLCYAFHVMHFVLAFHVMHFELALHISISSINLFRDETNFSSPASLLEGGGGKGAGGGLGIQPQDKKIKDKRINKKKQEENSAPAAKE